MVVEVFFLLARPEASRLTRMLDDGRLRVAYGVRDEGKPVFDLMAKYADVPMSLADACLVRMSETLPDPVMLTTDADFKIYRRRSRQVVPCLLP